MIDDTNSMIEEKARVYLAKNIPVHITKHSGEWLNGFIVEVSSEFLMLNEFKKAEMPVFFSEIKNIETYTKTEGENGE